MVSIFSRSIENCQTNLELQIAVFGSLPSINPIAHLLLLEAFKISLDELLVGVLVAVGGWGAFAVVAVLVFGRALIF